MPTTWITLTAFQLLGGTTMGRSNHFNRRLMLSGTGAAGVAAALAALPASEITYAAPERVSARGPAGSWIAVVTIKNGPPPFQVLRTFSDGGGYVETSSTSRNVLAPESSGHGTWARTGLE